MRRHPGLGRGLSAEPGYERCGEEIDIAVNIVREVLGDGPCNGRHALRESRRKSRLTGAVEHCFAEPGRWSHVFAIRG